jgi:hypothetical protein
VMNAAGELVEAVPGYANCVCEWCGVPFVAARSDARTCSVAHRLRWTRWARAWAAFWGRKPDFGPRGEVFRQASVGWARPGERARGRLFGTR